MRIIAALLAAATMATASQAIAQPAASPSVSDAAAEEASAALANADMDRLFEDKAYAEQTLAHIEVLRKNSRYSGDRQSAIDRVRMFALVGANRLADAFAQASELTRATPGDPALHFFAFLLGVDSGSDLALEELEFADQSLASRDDRIHFRDSLKSETVGYFRRRFFIANDKDRIARSAQALLNLGWPGPHKLDYADRLRIDSAEGLVAKGDIAGAKKLLFEVQSAEPVLQILVAKKWDAIRDSGDPAERLAQGIAASDQASAQALRARPDDLELLLNRAQFLRSVGKESEALELMLPNAADLAWLKDKGEQGYWLANEAAYALVALQRGKEAVALMDKLLSLGLAENPMLISMAINSVGVRIDSGDFRGAADYAEMLVRKHSDLAAPYGRMWMWEGAACAHTAANDPAKATPWMDKLKQGEKDNPAALTRALLCVNDLDGAAAILIRRIDGDDTEDVLEAVQDYSIGPDLPPTRKLLEQRLRQVVARPDVGAAIARHGRVMKVPLSRVYWGMF